MSPHIGKMTPAADTNSADWLVAALTTFGQSVVSIVPDGFPAYVRVFHPAYLDAHQTMPVTWASIAAAHGKQAHPAMQLIALIGTPDLYKADPGVYRIPPREARLPAGIVPPLLDALRSHTNTPGRCWFAIWHGFGNMEEPASSTRTFNLPSREYHLFGGPLDAVTDNVGQPVEYTPNLWWPDDHSWCVATEIDFNTTYIACDHECRDAILASPELEAAEIEPTARIDLRSDPVNPWPFAE